MPGLKEIVITGTPKQRWTLSCPRTQRRPPAPAATIAHQRDTQVGADGRPPGPVYVRYAQGTTFLSVIRQLAEADPGRPALTSGDQTLTRAGFVQRAEPVPVPLRRRYRPQRPRRLGVAR